ncbi:MAG: type III pantothenate kinase [Schwartzia sp. (in: firmicutes)]
MLLVFDIGNSNIVLGTYEGKKLLRHWRISTDRQKTGDEYGMLINNLFRFQGIRMSDVTAIIISSVVPPLVVPLAKMCERYFRLRPLIVGPGIKTGIKLRYENPREIGADRIVNSVGAYEQFGGPLIVVDIGTATTFDIVAENGDYLGGVIAPGIGISSEALFQRAAQLPRVALVTPRTIICRNTVTAMQAGVIFGFVGQIDEIVRRIKAEMKQDMRVIATGGLAKMISRESKTIDKVDNFLTLTGLRVLYERNQPEPKTP